MPSCYRDSFSPYYSPRLTEVFWEKLILILFQNIIEKYRFFKYVILYFLYDWKFQSEMLYENRFLKNRVKTKRHLWNQEYFY